MWEPFKSFNLLLLVGFKLIKCKGGSSNQGGRAYGRQCCLVFLRLEVLSLMFDGVLPTTGLALMLLTVLLFALLVAFLLFLVMILLAFLVVFPPSFSIVSPLLLQAPGRH